jgi:fatty acid desaturase
MAMLDPARSYTPAQQQRSGPVVATWVQPRPVVNDASVFSELVAARRPAAAMVKILLNWMCIAAVLLVVAHHPTWPYLLAGFLLVGVEQHALGLWMHEGIHWLIASNKALNDTLMTVFLSGPLMVPRTAFRLKHFAHHKHLGTAQDTKPVIFTRVDGRRFWYFLMKNCLGLQLFSIAGSYLSGHSPAEDAVEIPARRWMLDIAGIVAMQGVLLLVVSRIAPWTWYLWLWVLPWLTINRFVAGLRSVIEHQPLAPERHPFTRTLQPTLLDRFLFCRAGFQYHWTHHRYPSVPCFNLPRLDTQAEQPRRGYLETLSLLVRSSSDAA